MHAVPSGTTYLPFRSSSQLLRAFTPLTRFLHLHTNSLTL
jgi:hypothetical protein